MVETGKKGRAGKQRTRSKNSPGKVRTSQTINHKETSSKASGKQTLSRTRHHQTSDGTYIFECTRSGCGYRIPREEKAEIGSLRYDLKCPKCHNKQFKCLGKGDLPESFELSMPASNLDFDNIKPTDLGSN